MTKQTFKDFFHQTEHWTKPKFKKSKKKFTYAKLSAVPVSPGGGQCHGGGNPGSSNGGAGSGSSAGGSSGGGGGAGGGAGA